MTYVSNKLAELCPFAGNRETEMDSCPGGRARPGSRRIGSRIRALGPSNLNHGKQTAGGAVIAALLNAHGGARSKGRVDLIKRK